MDTDLDGYFRSGLDTKRYSGKKETTVIIAHDDYVFLGNEMGKVEEYHAGENDFGKFRLRKIIEDPKDEDADKDGILDDVDNALEEIAFFHNLFNRPLWGVECVANLMAQKQVRWIFGHIVKDGHNQGATLSIKSRRSGRLTIFYVDIFTRH